MEIHGLDVILKNMPFFKGMTDKQLEIIAGCASNATYQPGEYLFRQNDDAHHFFIVREGQVALDIGAPGHEPITIQTVGDEEVVGWSWLFEPYIWSFDARVTQPIRALVFDGRCLRQKCDDDHEIGFQLLERFSNLIISRLQATRMQLLDMYGS